MWTLPLCSIGIVGGTATSDFNFWPFVVPGPRGRDFWHFWFGAARAEALTEFSSSGRRPDETDLPGLMTGYQRGEAAAVDQLVARISPSLWRFFLSNSKSPADAEDLLQECWIRIHKARHTYRSSEPLLPWVFAIARYTKLDGYRKRRRRESKETLVDVLPEVGAADPPSSDESQKRFLRLLEQLPEAQREVIVMLKVSDMSLEEVARATSSSVGSIKQKAHRAYAKLRELIETEGV
jgi:RNA polymerase sigma-70 factor, ECF subfamily